MCEYCSGKKDLPIADDVGNLYIRENILHTAYDEEEINYCPMCGERLRVTCVLFGKKE